MPELEPIDPLRKMQVAMSAAGDMLTEAANEVLTAAARSREELVEANRHIEALRGKLLEFGRKHADLVVGLTNAEKRVAQLSKIAGVRKALEAEAKAAEFQAARAAKIAEDARKRLDGAVDLPAEPST